MSMVSIAKGEGSAEEYTPNPYGYGTCICLTEEQVELLGLAKNPPAAGTRVSIKALALVKRVTTEYDPAKEAAEGEPPEDVDVALELQITDMEVTGAGGRSSSESATMLYGGTD